MAASLAELKDLIKLALGTPETVNFKALNRLLVSIIQRLGVLYKKTDSFESIEGGKKTVTQSARKKTRHEDRDKLRTEEKNRRPSKGKDAEKKDLNEKTTRGPEEKTESQISSTEIIPGTDIEKEAGLEEDKKGDDTVSCELKTGSSGEAISNGEEKDEGKERKGSKASSEENSEEAEDRVGKRRRASQQSKQTAAPSSKTEDRDYNGKGGTKKRTKRKSKDNSSQKDVVDVIVDDYGSDYEADFDDDEGSSSGSDPHRNEFVPKQDFDDIVKRLQIMEKEINYSKGKAPLQQRDMGRGSSNINRVQVSDSAQVSTEALEKMEAMMKKRIELMGKDAEAKVAMIHDDMDNIMAQLDILPKPAELYKSYFPSWKMLEDALCKARPLQNNIEEVKDSYDMRTGSGVSKQMTKFLGAAGPTDTLFRAFEDLATLIERNKKSRLSFDVAEAKKEVSSKRASRVPSPGTPRAGGKSMTIEILKKSLAAQDSDESFSPEISASDDNQEPCMTPVERRSSTVVGMVDSGYLTFKMARLAEDIMGIRKEIDETQLWKDRIRVCEGDIRDLEDMITGMRGEVQLKEDRDHEILTILQTDMCELQNEVCGSIQKQTRQAHKEQMESFRQTINIDEQRAPKPGVVIDREARIRTQQLQMQVNSLHHIVAELQIKAPDILFSPAPTSLPTDAQHPWGTGRQGPGTHMRSGVGTTATATSPHMLIRGRSPSPSPPTSFNSVAIMEDRPAPLGGREDKDPKGKFVFSCETLSSKNTADTTEVTVVKSGLTKKEEEERTRMQQAITRLNTAHSLMAAKLEACCNQQTTEHRRLQDLMTRMHRDNMNRHGELQVQISELIGEEFESLPHGEELEHGQQPETNEQIFEDNGSPMEMKPPDSPQSQSKPGSASATLRSVKISSSSVMQTALLGFRKEFFGHLKDMYARIKRLEMLLPEIVEEVDPAGLKRPILQRFQCLSCDKRVDGGSHRGEGAVPLNLPELPRIAPTSPPRQRCSSIRSSGPRVKPIDVYEIPRQCGGSYTSSSKPRRISYFNNQGEAIEVPQEPVAVERVDVKGTDGHIYKGQTTKFGFDTSNNFAYSDERRRRLISLLQRKSD
ncbi:uncharacterized protein [Littorina saxatilis]|uniref:uncharacterized protein n=1 Tax=Littorina saxatilis TaxID=31220 RepID=UPI0038B5F679